MLVSFKVQVNVICEHMDSEISDVGLKGEDGQPLKSVNLMNIVDMQGKYHEEDLGENHSYFFVNVILFL